MRRFLFLLVAPLWAQSIYFMHSGGEDIERVKCTLLEDTSYVVAGESRSTGAGNFDIVIAKLDMWGNYLWSKSFGMSYVDVLNDLKRSHGGYVITGYTSSLGGGYLDLLLGVISFDGVIKWTKSVGLLGPDVGTAVYIGQRNEIFVVGHTEIADNTDILVGGFNLLGIKDFLFTLGTNGDEGAYSVLAEEDTVFYIGGFIEREGENRDILIAKVSKSGDVVWAKYIASQLQDVARALFYFNGNLLVVGESKNGDSLVLSIISMTRGGELIMSSALYLNSTGGLEDIQFSGDTLYMVGHVGGVDTLLRSFIIKTEVGGSVREGWLLNNSMSNAIYSISRSYPFLLLGGEMDGDFLIGYLNTLNFCGFQQFTPDTINFEFTTGDVSLSVEVPDFVEKYLYYDTMSWTPQWDYICIDTLNLPPSHFSLLYPPDSGVIFPLDTLKWEESVDPDSGDSVYYVVYLSRSPIFIPIVLEDTVTTCYYVPPILEEGLYYWKVRAVDSYGLSTWSEEKWRFFYSGYTPGDVDNNGYVDASDFIYLGNFLYMGGPPPIPYISGDVNGDCSVTSDDFIYLGDYLFYGGPAPLYCDYMK